MTAWSKGPSPSGGGPSPRWSVYRTDLREGGRVILGEIQAPTARAALAAYAKARGLSGRFQGQSALAVLGTGLLRAERITTVARPDELPSTEEMRAALALKGHPDADRLDSAAIELRYRQGVLREQKETRE